MKTEERKRKKMEEKQDKNKKQEEKEQKKDGYQQLAELCLMMGFTFGS